MSVKGRPEIPIVPDPSATAPPSVVAIKLETPTSTPVARVRMPEEQPQRAPATPPSPPAVEAAAQGVRVQPPEAKSNFLLMVGVAALLLGLMSVLLGMFVILLSGAIFLM